MIHPISGNGQIIFLFIHGIQTLAFGWPLKAPPLYGGCISVTLSKHFGHVVGDVEGHFNFAVTTLSRFLASTRGPVFEPPPPERESFLFPQDLDCELPLHGTSLEIGERIS